MQDIESVSYTHLDVYKRQIEKVKPVSKKYPRKAGLPTKEPLK